MTEADLKKYYETKSGKDVQKFIEKDRQDAVVYSVIQDFATRTMDVECYSPVWKSVSLYNIALRDFKRGDIISLARRKEGRGMYQYYIIENKNAEEAKQNGVNKILKNFSADQIDKIRTISEFLLSR